MTKTPEELTKEWKAGKLVAGYYYIKFKNGEIETRDNLIGGFLMNMKNPIVQILTPVPTYDEQKAMQAAIQNGESAIDTNKRLCKKIEELEDQIADLEKENKQLEEDTGYGWHTAGIESDKNDELRGMLRECKRLINEYSTYFDIKDFNASTDLLTRIDAALNETQANPIDCNKMQESEEI